jgi:hypothetical protein
MVLFIYLFIFSSMVFKKQKSTRGPKEDCRETPGFAELWSPLTTRHGRFHHKQQCCSWLPEELTPLSMVKTRKRQRKILTEGISNPVITMH